MALAAAAHAHAGSVYVPVDHWAYAVAERLAVLSGAQPEVLGMRPWTRAQFARFVERVREMPLEGEATGLQRALEREFAPELNGVQERLVLESAYARALQIGGTPLRDSYHFGQTIANDFGRPYGQGFNAVAGASGYGQWRAAMLYVRGEYQHAASLRGPSAAAIDVLAGKDQVAPSQVLTQGGGRQDNSRLLDTYVGASFWRWTATLGKHSLWWGPATAGAMLYSNNPEPVWMGRLTNDIPYTIPVLGKVRFDLFYGKLERHPYLPEPWIHGEKITFQPFRSVEVGFSRTVVFLGQGRDLTFKRLFNSYFNVDDTGDADAPENDPGDRRSGIEFSWKLPRIPVSLYSDAFSDDEPTPLQNPLRSSFHPGVYIAQLPGSLSSMDLRMEGAFTSSLVPSSVPDGFNYWNGVYRDGYTNKGQLIGDTVGRDGVMWMAETTYWISPRDKVQVRYRNQHVSPQFILGGGTQNDVRASTNFVLRKTIEVALGVQWERVVMPLLTGTTSPEHNVSGWAGVTLWPEHWQPN